MGYYDKLMADFEYVIKSFGNDSLEPFIKIRAIIDDKIKEIENASEEKSGADTDRGEISSEEGTSQESTGEEDSSEKSNNPTED